MNTYIGTKVVKSEPCKAWKESGAYTIGADGYKVVYEDGYTSWSPKAVFEKAYRKTSGMTFGEAIEAMKSGLKVARNGWNGKGMWLILVSGSENIKPVAGTPYSNAGLDAEIQILPHIDMYTVDSTGRRAMLPGWLASQSDMISEDWVVI